MPPQPIGLSVADNLFEQPKGKEKGESAALKIDLVGREPAETRQEPLSLLSITSLSTRKAIADTGTSAEEIATASPVSKVPADHSKRHEMISVGKEGDSLKSIYEDGVLKLYDEPGKGHFGFKFLEPGGTNKAHLAVGAARKEKFEDLIKGVAFEFRVKF